MKTNKKEQLMVMMEVAAERNGKAFYDDAITFAAKKIAGVVDATSSNVVTKVETVEIVDESIKAELEAVKKELKSTKAKLTKEENDNKKLKDEITKLKELLESKEEKPVEQKEDVAITTTSPVLDMSMEEGDIVEVYSKVPSKCGRHTFNYGKIFMDGRQFFYKIANSDNILLAEVLGASFEQTVRASKLLRAKYNLSDREYNELALSECFDTATLYDEQLSCLVKKMPNSDTYQGYIGKYLFKYTPGLNKHNQESKPGIDICNSLKVYSGQVKAGKTDYPTVYKLQDIAYKLIAKWEGKQKVLMPSSPVLDLPTSNINSSSLGTSFSSVLGNPICSDISKIASMPLNANSGVNAAE